LYGSKNVGVERMARKYNEKKNMTSIFAVLVI